MQYVFYECRNLNSLDISTWDTKNVENMLYMFTNCNTLPKLNIRSFDISNVTKMHYMFSGTRNLKPIYVGEKWIIKSGTDVTSMFSGSKTSSENQLCKPDSTHEWCIVN